MVFLEEFMVRNVFGKFVDFLKEDSWPSFVVTLVLALLFIKFIFFPLLSLITGTSLPLVIVESCSMYHSDDFGEILENDIYADYGIDINSTEDWDFKRGMNKGDIIFVLGAELEDLEVGEVVIFDSGGQTAHPIIHRVIDVDLEDREFTTKGDNNEELLQIEREISEDKIIGRAVLRAPYLGWAKLIFFDFRNPPSRRGLC